MGGLVTMKKNLGFASDGSQYVSADNMTRLLFKTYLGEKPPGGSQFDFEFPCQYAYDAGLCSNLILKGLCAHTCTPLKVAVLQGNITKYQDTVLALDYVA